MACFSNVQLRLVLGHSSLIGNEEAYFLVKKGAMTKQYERELGLNKYVTLGLPLPKLKYLPWREIITKADGSDFTAKYLERDPTQC